MSSLTARERSNLVLLVRNARRSAADPSLRCSSCGRDKPDEEFFQRTSAPNSRRGRSYECKQCGRKRVASRPPPIRGRACAELERLLKAIAEPSPLKGQCICAECEALRGQAFARRGLEIIQGGAP